MLLQCVNSDNCLPKMHEKKTLKSENADTHKRESNQIVYILLFSVISIHKILYHKKKKSTHKFASPFMLKKYHKSVSHHMVLSIEPPSTHLSG